MIRALSTSKLEPSCWRPLSRSIAGESCSLWTSDLGMRHISSNLHRELSGSNNSGRSRPGMRGATLKCYFDLVQFINRALRALLGRFNWTRAIKSSGGGEESRCGRIRMRPRRNSNCLASNDLGICFSNEYHWRFITGYSRGFRLVWGRRAALLAMIAAVLFLTQGQGIHFLDSSIRGTDCRNSRPHKGILSARVWLFGPEPSGWCVDPVVRIHDNCVSHSVQRGPGIPSGPRPGCASLLLCISVPDMGSR